MFRIAVYILLLFAAAAGFAWLADNPGTVTVIWPWAENRIEISLLMAVIAIVVIAIVIMALWWMVSALLNSPKSFGRWRAGRRRDKGYAALSKGLIAAGAGNAPLARRLARDSDKLLENEPLVALLDAQTALLEGNRAEARKKFETMLGNEDTRLLGLRGLYLEAEQEGQIEAAAHFAGEADKLSPGTPWASQAVLKISSMTRDWQGALAALEKNRANNADDKQAYARKKAVLLTALALEEEDATPDKAKAHALAAHKLAPDLVPAAVTAARVAARLNDVRKAGKVLEASWAIQPHPETADTYIHLRSGDTVRERLKRAEKLYDKAPDHPESCLAVAMAAVEAEDFKRARETMDKALRNRPTERACLIMADIEEAEHGDRGRVREWLSRAVSAPKDEAWTADGVIAEEWAPVSPTTGRLDAFEWKRPVEQLGSSSRTVDYTLLINEPLGRDINDVIKDASGTSRPASGSSTAGPLMAAAVSSQPGPETSSVSNGNTVPDDDIEDAQIIEVTPSEAASGTVAVSQTTEEPTETTKEAEPVKGLEKMESTSVKTESVETRPDSASPSATGKPKPVKTDPSPYHNPNLDSDEDGVIDRRPDDPGIENEAPTKKGWLF